MAQELSALGSNPWYPSQKDLKRWRQCKTCNTWGPGSPAPGPSPGRGQLWAQEALHRWCRPSHTTVEKGCRLPVGMEQNLALRPGEAKAEPASLLGLDKARLGQGKGWGQL